MGKAWEAERIIADQGLDRGLMGGKMEEDREVREVRIRGGRDDLNQESLRVRDGGGALGPTEANEKEGDKAMRARGGGRRGGIGCCGNGVSCQGEKGGGKGR